jgi:hypothetical protein
MQSAMDNEEYLLPSTEAIETPHGEENHMHRDKPTKRGCCHCCCRSQKTKIAWAIVIMLLGSFVGWCLSLSVPTVDTDLLSARLTGVVPNVLELSLSVYGSMSILLHNQNAIAGKVMSLTVDIYYRPSAFVSGTDLVLLGSSKLSNSVVIPEHATTTIPLDLRVERTLEPAYIENLANMAADCLRDDLELHFEMRDISGLLFHIVPFSLSMVNFDTSTDCGA